MAANSESTRVVIFKSLWYICTLMYFTCFVFKEVERRKQLQQLIFSGKIMLDKVIKLINVDKSCLESRSAGVN